MENIYVQTELERNSIVDIPDDLAEKSGNTLYSWLGSFWRSVHKGDDMVRGLQSARGIRLAQMYLDVLEAARLQDRNGAPVFHRELWHPIVVRQSSRNKAQENMISIGGTDKSIGPQPSGSEYGEGTVFQIGRMADYANHVTYPVDSSIAGGAATIVDNIVNPTVLMERGEGADFDIRNGTIVFPKENDPLAAGSPFEKYDIPGNDPDHPEIHDTEAVLWASDVLIDKNYVSDHISYALGADAPSSAAVKRILNAAWSSVTSGLTPELVRTLMAAMLNIPVIQHERETVKRIYRGEGGATVVETDAGSYMVSPKARLRDVVQVGSTLSRGELLDESLRIYPFINGISDPPPNQDSSSSSYSPDQAGGDPANPYGFSVPIEQDIPSVVIPRSMIRARTEHGVFAMWGESKVRSVESGGRKRLMFDVGGDPEDVSAFWDDVWSNADRSGIDLSSVIGEEGSKVSPARFFIRNLVGANTMFVVVDRSQVDDDSMMRDPMFFDMLMDAVPSAIRLFLVEHRPVGDDDRVDMDAASESESVSAALPAAAEEMPCKELSGASGRGPSFGDYVSIRFVRPSPAKTRGRKEEEI